MRLKMRLKAKILLVWNTLFLIPIILYLIFWTILTLFVVTGEGSNILVLVFLVLIAVLLYSIYSAIRLKLRILKEVGDNFLAPIRSTYLKATLINILGYLVFYPIILTMIFGFAPAIGIISILIAIIIAVPMLRYIKKAQYRYERIKCEMRIGKARCKKCKVTVFYNPNHRQWICYRCGRRS